jgi:hypothetical protein
VGSQSRKIGITENPQDIMRPGIGYFKISINRLISYFEVPYSVKSKVLSNNFDYNRNYEVFRGKGIPFNNSISQFLDFF